jgi:hypothetical protein
MACQMLRGQDRIAVLLEAEDQKPSALSPAITSVLKKISRRRLNFFLSVRSNFSK